MLSTVLRILLVIAACYALLVLAAFLLQRRLLYFPDPGAPSNAQLQAVGLHSWPENGGSFRGYVGSLETAATAGTVIVFHGNAGAAWHRAYYVAALEPLGYRVILAEYPGYGGRAGHPGESVLVADARETIRQVYARYGEPVFLWGESLGGGVAAAAVAQPATPIAGIVLLTPWDALPNLAQSIYPLLPVRWLLLDRYNNIDNLRHFDRPVAVVIAEYDEVIPPTRAERLYQSLRDPKQRWSLRGAGHNSWPTDPHHTWWGQVMRFLTSDSSAPQTPGKSSPQT